MKHNISLLDPEGYVSLIRYKVMVITGIVVYTCTFKMASHSCRLQSAVARGEEGTPEQQPAVVHFQAVMVGVSRLCCAIEAWKSCLSCVTMCEARENVGRFIR